MVGTEPRTGLFTVKSATFVGGCMRVINFLRRSVDIRMGRCCLTRTRLSLSLRLLAVFLPSGNGFQR